MKTLLTILGCYPNLHLFTQIDFVMLVLQYTVAWKSKYAFETSKLTLIWVTREVLVSVPLPIHEPKYSRLQDKLKTFQKKDAEESRLPWI